MSQMQDTSLQAYYQLKNLGTKQKRVLEEIKIATELGGDITDYELSKVLHDPINEVTPRRGELVREGLIVQAGRRFNRDTKRWAITWKTTGERRP